MDKKIPVVNFIINEIRNLNFEKRQKYIYSTNIPIGYILFLFLH